MTKKRFIVLALAVSIALTSSVIFERSRRTDRVTEALSATIIEHFDLEEISGTEAVALLVDYIQEQHPELGRIEVVGSCQNEQGDGPKQDSRLVSSHITFNLRNVPADKALGYISQLCYLRYTIRSGIISFEQIQFYPKPTAWDQFINGFWSIYWHIYEIIY